LVINYHDFLHRTDCVISLVSRFLELEKDEFVTRVWADMILEFQKGRRPKETLSHEQQSFVQAHADRAAEAWILDGIDRQWRVRALRSEKLEGRPYRVAERDGSQDLATSAEVGRARG
jgi:hypothetical protein